MYDRIRWMLVVITYIPENSNPSSNLDLFSCIHVFISVTIVYVIDEVNSVLNSIELKIGMSESQYRIHCTCIACYPSLIQRSILQWTVSLGIIVYSECMVEWWGVAWFAICMIGYSSNILSDIFKDPYGYLYCLISCENKYIRFVG